VVVSHDRYLLERVTDRQWAMYGDGKIVDLPGGVDEYLAKRHSKTSEVQTQVQTQKTSSQSDIRQAKKEISRIEKRLDKINTEEHQLHQKIADNPTDYDAVAKLDIELQALAEERENLELEWLAAAEIVG